MDTHFQIELARPVDALVIAQMSRDLIETGLRWSWKPSRVLSMIQDRDSVVIVARSGKDIAGFAVMEFQEVHAHLNLLAVRPVERRGGIGKALVEWLEASAQVAGIASIVLEVRHDNRGARTFYESLGYRGNQVLQGYYQGKENALRMAHQLMAPEVAAQRP